MERLLAAVRTGAAPYDQDRYFAPDLAFATDFVLGGRARDYAASLLPSTR